MSNLERVSLAEFMLRLATYAESAPRKIVDVHLHHTWRPRHRDWRGLPTMQAMRRYHMTEGGMRDIAQHLTIDPHGGLWLGRPFAWPPGSAKGHNGTSREGPFMIEVVGDFDAGQDTLTGLQLTAVVDAITAIAESLGLNRSTAALVEAWLHPHRKFARKSCPGDSLYAVGSGWVAIDGRSLVERIAEHAAGNAPEAAILAGRREASTLVGRDLRVEVEDKTVPEFDADMGSVIADLADRYSLESRGLDVGAVTAERSSVDLSKHVVNSRLGELSSSGYSTTTEGLEKLFQVHLRSWLSDQAGRAGKEDARPAKVLLWAHGGLVGEKAALKRASDQAEFWIANRIYPIYFVWETGFVETLGQMASRGRGFSDLTDYIQERIARVGKSIWSAMRNSAWRNSQATLDEGGVGAAVLVKQHLVDLFRSLESPPELHVVGHSAGSIFLAEMIAADLLAGEEVHGRTGVPLASVQFLAPALRRDRFRDEQLPLLGKTRFAMYTMSDERERDDHCGPTYRKSLLYLVRQALEIKRKTPLLGLERDVLDDGALRTAFGIPGSPGQPANGASHHRQNQIHVYWSREPNGSSVTNAISHGGFDDDPKTLDSLVRFIHELPADAPIHHPYVEHLKNKGRSADRSGVDWSALGVDAPMTESAAGVTGASPSRLSVRPPGGQRLAVCVGIDRYQDKPLDGAVADAREWEKYLVEAQGFSLINRLLDEQATLKSVVIALDELVRRGRRGDVLAFFFSGHGTQCPDIRSPNGDRDEPDGFDEALVPVDAPSAGYLLDDLIAARLQPLAEGCKLVMVMDCCHSGTNMRFAPGASVMADERARYAPASESGLDATRTWVRQSGLRPGDTRATPSVLHFAACRDDEYAYESNGRGHFSLHMLAELRRGGADHTPAKLIAEVRRRFGAVRRQTPLFHTGPWRDQAVFAIGGTGEGRSGGLASPRLPFLGP